MGLEQRIKILEQRKGQDTEHEPRPDSDDIIRKLGLASDIVRATAREKNQSMAEVIAGELGMSYADFIRALKLRA